MKTKKAREKQIYFPDFTVGTIYQNLYDEDIPRKELLNHAKTYDLVRQWIKTKGNFHLLIKGMNHRYLIEDEDILNKLKNEEILTTEEYDECHTYMDWLDNIVQIINYGWKYLKPFFREVKVELKTVKETIVEILREMYDFRVIKFFKNFKINVQKFESDDINACKKYIALKITGNNEIKCPVTETPSYLLEVCMNVVDRYATEEQDSKCLELIKVHFQLTQRLLDRIQLCLRKNRKDTLKRYKSKTWQEQIEYSGCVGGTKKHIALSNNRTS